MLENEYHRIYSNPEKFQAQDHTNLYRSEFITKFPDVEIKPRPKKLKSKIVKAAPYANI
jgi:hypothetical protein